MSSLNKVMLIGNLGRDPEIRVTQSGSKIANFSIATSDRRTDKATGEKTETTEWHRLIAFTQLAEIIEKYVTKGSKVYIEGRLQTRKWTDKDQVERYTTEILVDKLVMLSGKADEAGDTAPAAKAAKVTAEAPFDDAIPW